MNENEKKILNLTPSSFYYRIVKPTTTKNIYIKNHNNSKFKLDYTVSLEGKKKSELFCN